MKGWDWNSLGLIACALLALWAFVGAPIVALLAR